MTNNTPLAKIPSPNPTSTPASFAAETAAPIANGFTVDANTPKAEPKKITNNATTTSKPATNIIGANKA